MALAQLCSSLALGIPAFGTLSPEKLDALVTNADRRFIKRNETLVRQGDPSETLHFVISGRFTAHNDRIGGPFAEIGPGQPIGEIGFFANVPRTATVIALRDSEILSISRHQFDQLTDSSPHIRDAVIVSLANRLAEARLSERKLETPRTLALLPAGGSRLSPRFLESLRKVFGARSQASFLTIEEIASRFPNEPLDGSIISSWLNSRESEAECIFYVADDKLTDWTRKCIRQGDAIVLVATAGVATDLNDAERFALSVHPFSVRRLVILHESRTAVASGTSAWLRERDVFMHHHVSLQDTADVSRLYRFLSNQAVGFVAGGGGALGSAHLGVYKAFVEIGADFDILGGTSVGAAMTGALALGVDPDGVDAQTHTMFVKARSFRRYTVPYFGILNHKIFDRELKSFFGNITIEDLWRPFFAISANLSTNKIMVHRRGTLWRAVRASSSIPAALPPFFTEDREMLVDGGIIDNVPLAPMKAIKTGPNVVVALSVDEAIKHEIIYDSIPGPGELAFAIINPFARRNFAKIPSIVHVMIRSICANRQRLSLAPMDILIQPKFPANIAWTDWSRHSELFLCVYRETASPSRVDRGGGPPRDGRDQPRMMTVAYVG